jgi:hypothetical protein
MAILRVEVVDPEVVIDLAVRVGVAGAGGVVKRLPIPGIEGAWRRTGDTQTGSIEIGEEKCPRRKM